MQTKQKPALSHSALNMLMRCGLQYQFRYLDNIIQPPGVALIVGKGTDKAVSEDLTSKKDNGVLLPDEAVAAIAADAVKLTWHGEEPVLDDDEKQRGKDRVLGDAVDMAVSLARLHHKELAPTIKPTFIQRPWRVQIEGVSHDLIGFIDVQEERGIRDTKTAGKSPADDAAEKNLQLTMYALAAYVNDGKLPEYLTLDYLVKLKTPKAVVLKTARSEDDLRRLLDRIARAITVIKSGAYLPTDPSNWWCSKRFCGYWDRCPFGARQAVSVSLSEASAGEQNSLPTEE